MALTERAIYCNGSEDRSPSGFTLPAEFEGIVAFTLTMRSVIQHIIEAAAEDIPVLITGETGTGKDLVAAAIHKRSKRKTFPYVPINMEQLHRNSLPASSLAMREGLTQARLKRVQGCLNRLTVEPFFSTRSPLWTKRRR